MDSRTYKLGLGSYWDVVRVTVHVAPSMILWMVVCFHRLRPAHLCGMHGQPAAIVGLHQVFFVRTPPNLVNLRIAEMPPNLLNPRRSRWLQNNRTRENPWSCSLCRQKSRSNVTFEWRTCLIRTSNSFKGAGSRPRTNFCLVTRDLYLRNYCWYCRESNVYARRPARAVHNANYERKSVTAAASQGRLNTALMLIKLTHTSVAKVQFLYIHVTWQGEDSNREFLRVLCLEV